MFSVIPSVWWIFFSSWCWDSSMTQVWHSVTLPTCASSKTKEEVLLTALTVTSFCERHKNLDQIHHFATTTQLCLHLSFEDKIWWVQACFGTDQAVSLFPGSVREITQQLRICADADLMRSSVKEALKNNWLVYIDRSRTVFEVKDHVNLFQTG